MVAHQEKQEEIMQTLGMLIESMRREKGCRNYQVYQNIMNENWFSSYGEWDSHDELDRYLRSDKFSVLLGMKSLLSDPMQIQILTVSHSEGIEFIRALRGKAIPHISSPVQKGDIKEI